jgi:hypothetical protein
MSQDYSRINFDPGDDYLGVLLQQGRPLTDADWNALVLQLNRRTQAGTLDTFGPAVVPEQTEDGFLIEPAAGGFTIGRGRIYVDGLLAENHGAGARTWDPHLAEEFRPDPVAWNAQPYLPTPDAIPAFPYLVYVDVWQREVTELSEKFPAGHPEARRLIDAAIGVDTTQRLQTVWQVRTLGVGAGTDCGTPLDTIAAWNERTAPSAGRLTTATGIVAGEPDPCLVPPLGGYKGAENQLYRVEIQTGGAPGTATFKWSRDNGSVQARVVTIPDGTHLVLDSIGKDSVLRFKPGDWIEITDDFRELMGLPGILCRIVPGAAGVSDSTRTLTLVNAIPAGTFPVDAQFHPAATRNTRIRKWDQSGIVKRADGTTYVDVDTTNGEIVIPADGSTLLIENGILVTFGLSPAGGQFHVGDWWVFAARTNGASVEILDAAPPRGTHHHYAKLAVVSSATDIEDCRELWPPNRGCCTRVVRPGQDIQAAIDSLPPVGGCVCLKSGVHEIDEPLRIENSNIILHGEAPGVRVVGTDMTELIRIGGEAAIENIEVAMISFEYGPPTTVITIPNIMSILGARRVHVHDCAFRWLGATQQPVAVYVSGSREVRIVGSLVESTFWGILVDGKSREIHVEENTFRGGWTADAAGNPLPNSFFGVLYQPSSTGCVSGNEFEDYMSAVFTSGGTEVKVVDNSIRRRPLSANIDDPGSTGALLYAIVAGGRPGTSVHGNHIDLRSRGYGGIFVPGVRVEVANNTFASEYEMASTIGPVGVAIGDFSGPPSGAGDFTTVSENHFSGMQVAVTAMNPTGIRITDNTMTGLDEGDLAGAGVTLTNCLEAYVADNEFRRVGFPLESSNGVFTRIVDNTVSSALVGADFTAENGLDFTGNSIHDAAYVGIVTRQLVGSATFANSRISNCGWMTEDRAISLAAMEQPNDPRKRIALSACEILDTGVSGDGTRTTAGVAHGVWGLYVGEWHITANRFAYSASSRLLPDHEHDSMQLAGPLGYEFTFGDRLFEYATGAVLINDNVFHGPAQRRLVDIRQQPLNAVFKFHYEKLTFSNNRLDHTGAVEVVTADLYGFQMIVSGNQVKTVASSGHSIGLGNRPRPMVVGNYTTRSYVQVDLGTVMPTPLASFNI